MGVLSEGDQDVQERLKAVCSALNMDRQSSLDALQTFDAIARNYTLEVSYCMILLFRLFFRHEMVVFLSLSLSR